MPYFKTDDGCSLYYTARNDQAEKAAVFLNGTTQTTVSWIPLAKTIPDSYRVVSYDARAQGKSDLGTLPLSQKLHAYDLKALFDHLDIERAALVGISHGANIAIIFSSLFPQKADGLFLMSMGAGFPKDSLARIQSWLTILEEEGLEKMVRSFLPYVFTREFYKINRDSADMIADAMVKRNKQESMVAHLKAMLQYKPLSDFPVEPSIPALAIHGAGDQLVEAEKVRLLAKMCNGQFAQIDKAGHSIPAERPDVLSELLIDFLDSKLK
jgi:3-oxoadipate enol-lactonase